MDKQTIQILVILAFIILSGLAEVLKRKGKGAPRDQAEPRPNPWEPEESTDPASPFGESAGFPEPEEFPEPEPAPVPIPVPVVTDDLPEQMRVLTERLERMRATQSAGGRPESLAATLARTRKEAAQRASRRSGASLLLNRKQLRQAVLLSEILASPAAVRGDQAIRNAGNERVP